jgi:predicted  nucleic acid-binding Zn-ribbon protein
VSTLDELLLVQERDLALDRLRHRRTSLPERSELAAREVDAARVDTEVKELQRGRDEVFSEERRLDDEARSMNERAREMEQRLYSGSISSPRELQAMQADVDMLKRNREGIEDHELEFMEQRERFDQELATAEATLAELRVEVERLRAAIADAEREIDAEMAVEEAARADHATRVTPSLLADYERRRGHNRGAGAARLIGDTCQACHLSIPSTEVENIRRAPEGSISYCDNCGAILVP